MSEPVSGVFEVLVEEEPLPIAPPRLIRQDAY
jgi:hypothetical protein